MNNKTSLDERANGCNIVDQQLPTLIIGCYILRQFALSVIACCFMQLGVVALSLKPVCAGLQPFGFRTILKNYADLGEFKKFENTFK